MVTTIKGGTIRPARATAAPGAPPKREPNTTEKFTTFGPGRNCESAKASLNSSAVIQCFCSTILRRAHGSAPPNPEMETTTKAENSSGRDGRTDAAGGSGWDICIKDYNAPQRSDRRRRAIHPCAVNAGRQ